MMKLQIILKKREDSKCAILSGWSNQNSCIYSICGWWIYFIFFLKFVCLNIYAYVLVHMISYSCLQLVYCLIHIHNKQQQHKYVV